MDFMQIFDLVAMTLTFTALVRPMIHALQRGNYRPVAIWNILFTRYYSVLIVMQVVMFVVVISPIYYQSLVLAVGCVVLTVVANKGRSKLPLRYTPRAIRLFFVCMVLIFGVLWHIPSYLVPMFLPLVVLLAWCIVLPIEKLVCYVYWSRAHTKLLGCTAVKIAVTGSYGKTSVKVILAHLLGGVASPSSYNTPMGISKFVNSTNLNSYPYVVLEMGARHRGDIRQLCKLCVPDIGVVVGVAPQHIETLGGLAGVVAVKQELLHHIGSGRVFLSGYDSEVSSWGEVGNCTKILSTDIVDCSVSSVTARGTTITVKYNGELYTVDTQLVGVAHTNNISLALSVALSLGIDIETLLYRVSTLEPIAHRMQYICGAVDIIDDSYNANLYGVQLCCHTVANMSYDTKIVIAQGVVEGGSMSYTINKQIGKLLGDTFGIVVLVGVNSSSMSDGIEGNCTVLHATSCDNAVELASEYYSDSCLLVFNNDIP